MTEPIFLIIGIAMGYALCYISTLHAASATERALEVMTSAWNARFAPKAKVEVQQSTVGEPSIVTDPTQPAKIVKTVPEWNINALRQVELAKIAAQEKAVNEAVQHLP